MSGARRALAFLTPIGGAVPPAPSALPWFPVVGAAIGAVLGLVWWAAGHAWDRVVAAVIVVGLDLALTGLLHVDGLADAADGLLPHLERSRRLAVMREPAVGAFGVAVVALVLVARVAALSSAVPSVLLLAGLWAASRAFMAVVARTVRYARGPEPRPGDPGGGGGLVSAFLVEAAAAPEGPGTPPARAARPSRVGPALVAGLVGAALAEGCVAAWRPVAGTVALACGLVAALGVVWLARRRLGGFTGDVLGASGVVLETVALLVAAARW